MSVIWAVYYMQDSKMATEAILGQSFVFAPLSPTLAPWSRNIGDQLCGCWSNFQNLGG